MATLFPNEAKEQTLLPSTAPPFLFLLWPRWQNPADLRLGLNQFGAILASRPDAALVLLADPAVDGSLMYCEKLLHAELSRTSTLQSLRVILAHETLTPEHLDTLQQKITVTGVLPSIMMPGRAKILERINAPLMFGHTELRETIKSWEAMKRGVRLSWRSPPDPLPAESPIAIPQKSQAVSGWLGRRIARDPSDETKRLAIIVPYRDRANHLAALAPYLADYISDIPFDLFVIEQANQKPFNRGTLLNIGFDQIGEAYDYFAVHDVDMFPVDADYSYVDTPTHLAVRVGPKYQLHYETCMGGIVLLNRTDFQRLNGFSNEFWGWGGEDDDFYLRMYQLGLHPERRDGLFDALPHTSNAYAHPTYHENIERLERMRNRQVQASEDGLSSLKYRLISVGKSESYYRLKVDI